MARLARTALLLVCTAGGVVLGRSTVDPPLDGRAPSRTPGPAATPPAVPMPSPDVLRADIRRILKDELQLARVF
ncbi:MAG: hypothetical protein E6J90_03140 [Deltaproteobacteria bacterium]|nr:MAG: hypothetical protein E6J91_46455 [Deltaproteobacteria bacterium]TMQ27122.1 MAG: hypothetical protein E6J90_03140 [Deltaproteobacteria bacterium]